jgi:hypothetical protein
MAYRLKFMHFTTKASYLAERSKCSGDALTAFDNYIAFVDEGPTIYTRGKEYDCQSHGSDTGYFLPIASGSELGGVMVDGDTVSIDDTGLLSITSSNVKQALGYTPERVLTAANWSGGKVSAGYSYKATGTSVTSLDGFSATNPSAVIYSTSKLTFSSISNLIKMADIDSVSGTYYIYVFNWIYDGTTAGKVAVNCAAYA